MTYIAIHCTKESAEIWTDTASYLVAGTGFRPTSKVQLIAHLDAAVTASGDGQFTNPAKFFVTQQAALAEDFDDLVGSLQPILQDLWTETGAGGPDDMWANVFVVGYSPAADSFQGWKFSSRFDFEPDPIVGLSIAPALFGTKLDRSGLAELAHALRDPRPEEAEVAEELLAEAPTWGPLSAPESMSGWIALAQLVREERALKGPWARIWVAGQLQRTTLERGLVATMKVWDFEDTGEELVQLVTGSFHPVAQISPCICGSDSAALDCCLASFIDQPCVCDSTRPFRDCCMVTDRDAVPRQLWTAAPPLPPLIAATDVPA